MAWRVQAREWGACKTVVEMAAPQSSARRGLKNDRSGEWEGFRNTVGSKGKEQI